MPWNPLSSRFAINAASFPVKGHEHHFVFAQTPLTPLFSGWMRLTPPFFRLSAVNAAILRLNAVNAAILPVERHEHHSFGKTPLMPRFFC